MKHKNVFLVGPMGAGKTTIGRQLADVLGLQFMDSDQEIESRTGANIPLIFDIEGEEGFRDREENIIDELTRQPGIVLATGGGAVLREVNRQNLKSRGTVVYLYAEVDHLIERTRFDRNRPLLQTEDPRARLQELMEQREHLYREVADIVINTASGNSKHIAKQILTQLKNTE